MIGLDTNVLIAAHRSDAENHEVCYELLEKLARSARPFALFWPSLYEFLRVVTHHRVFDPPTTVNDAGAAIDDFIGHPNVILLSEGPAHRQLLRDILAATPVTGNLLHDAHLVALALEYGVHELITYDQDFKRFSQISSRRP